MNVTYDASTAKALFLEASELSGDQRSGFLDTQCEGKPELRARVETLLRSFDDAGTFLAKPVVEELDMTRLSPKLLDPNVAADLPGSDGEKLPFLEPCDTPDRIGKIDDYEIIEIIGQGGMGIVLKAYDQKLHRVVALKVLAPHMATSATAVKRFLREARAAAAVSHDHVVTIFAVQEHGDCPYLVMECVVGQSLQQKIDRSSPLGLKETLRIGMQIASGLAAAHKQGLVHRDIKPSNILLENGVERVKLTDFGLARAVDDVDMTQTGQITGTPQYMSPEQAMGERVDSRSDLFSLGSVLYSMCTGRPAFRAETAVAVLRRVCDDTPRPIREINPETPAWLVAIIDKLLAKNPDDRFQTAAEVAELFSQCLAWARQPVGQSPPSIPKSVLQKRPTSRMSARTAAMWLVCFAVICLLALPARHFRDWEFSKTEVTSRKQPFGTTNSNNEPDLVGSADSIASTTETSTSVPAPPYLLINPLNETEIQAGQQRCADELKLPVEYSNPLGMKFRLIPPCQFEMGNAFDETLFLLDTITQRGADEYTKFAVKSGSPQHAVRLTTPYYIGQFEVTATQFQKFVEEKNYVSTLESLEPPRFTWRQSLRADTAETWPVYGVSWTDAKAFCDWLTKRENLHYDLPTEAQWEYACRAGNDGRWCFGNSAEPLSEYAVFGRTQQDGPLAIGSKKANAFGLYDMHGNVEEWCRDWHKSDFYAKSPLNDPACEGKITDPSSGRVHRGGAWNSTEMRTRSAIRMYDFPSIPANVHGFRVVITGDLDAIKSEK